MTPEAQAWLADLPSWVGGFALYGAIALIALVLVTVLAPPKAPATHESSPCRRCGATRGTPSGDVLTCSQVLELQARMRESEDRLWRQHGR